MDPGRGLPESLLRTSLGVAARGVSVPHRVAVHDVAGLAPGMYRWPDLAAGLAEGRLHLAAYALGACASGMTFLDSEIPALLGEPLDALLFTCVGVPEYAAAPAGRPGAPATVHMVAPRPGQRSLR